MAFPPVSDPGKVRVVYAEDSEGFSRPMKAGLIWLLGIDENNLHHFTELDEAKDFIDKERGSDLPTVVILDNNTPESAYKGDELALELLSNKAEHPNLIVVSVSSSDMGYFYKDGSVAIRELKQGGAEFWIKYRERNLMLLWLSECMKKGEQIKREVFLQGLAIESDYQKIDENDNGPEEDAICDLTLSLGDYLATESPEQILKNEGWTRGEFFQLSGSEVLAKLGFAGRGIERVAATKETLM